RADQGHHNFAYALYPHQGDWRGKVDAAAAALNNPVRLSGSPEVDPFVISSHENIVVETLKSAELDEGFVIRVYEAHRKSGPVNLQFLKPLKSVSVCNLLEDIQDELELVSNSVSLTLRPFEIITLLCKLS
ncbi:MAG: glycosyl hydrolase-related protein, partial [Pseudomonadota bacterium]